MFNGILDFLSLTESEKNTVNDLIKDGCLKIVGFLLFFFEGHLHQRCERAGHRAEAEAGDC